jgi:hypothetical protein
MEPSTGIIPHEHRSSFLGFSLREVKHMNPSNVRYSSEISNVDCADFFTMAERELSAFFHAVTELFGPEEAEHSAAVWLDELEAIKNLPGSQREWRSITTKVSTHLANRVNTSIAIG